MLKVCAKLRICSSETILTFLSQVTGIADYIYGDYYLYQFNYIRKRLETNQKIELVLVERQTGELKNINDEYSAKEVSRTIYIVTIFNSR